MKKIILLLNMFIISVCAMALNIEEGKITDSMGNSVEAKEYESIIAIDPAAVEVFYMIGGEDSIAAIARTTTTKIWPEDKTEKLPSVGTITKPSIEHVISYSPDLVILNPMVAGFGDILKSRNIPFIINSGNNFDEILNNVSIYGVLAGREEEAAKVRSEYEEKLAELRVRVEDKPLGLKGAFLFSTSPLMAFNSKSLPGQVFDLLGIENIADNLPGGRPIISAEFMIASNPNVLLGAMGIAKKEDIVNSNPFVKDTEAGKTGNIAIVDSDKILRPTPRIIEVVSELYEELSIES